MVKTKEPGMAAKVYFVHRLSEMGKRVRATVLGAQDKHELKITHSDTSAALPSTVTSTLKYRVVPQIQW